MFVTYGVRFDQHSQNLNEDSERISVAYLSDLLGAKLKSSYGTGIKFPKRIIMTIKIVKRIFFAIVSFCVISIQYRYE